MILKIPKKVTPNFPWTKSLPVSERLYFNEEKAGFDLGDVRFDFKIVRVS